MSDVANTTSSSNVFKSFGASSKTFKKPAIQLNNQQVTQAAIKDDVPPKTTSSKLEKVMPYVATGVSVAAIGVSAAAITKSNKNTKTVLKKIEQIEKSFAEGKGAVTQENVKNATSFIVGVLGAATGGAIVNHFDKNKDALKKIGMTDEEINASKVQIQNASLERENKLSRAENTANEAVRKAQEADGRAQNAENKVNGVEGKANQAIDTANNAINKVNAANPNLTAMAIHRKPYYGLNLMVINNNDKYVNTTKLKSALTDIHTAVTYRNGRKPGETEQLISNYRKKYVPLMKSNATWAITAEFDPIKAGGLGSVPMEIQNNFADMGIDNPVFIPMYQHKGNSEFIEYGNDKDGKKCKYIYGGETFDLEKMAEMPVQQYRGDKVINQNVEFYLGHVKRKDVNGKAFANPDQPIVFVKNTNNFGGDIYANGFNADEPEKFAFLSKAVYQLAVAKVSQALGDSKTGLGEIKIVNQKAYDEVKPPVAMMLNDWHAAPMSGLLRYKAPMENAYNVISDKTKDALRDMPLVMVGHNAGIPGSTRNHSIERSDMVTENIINTLYDGYALGITENAHTGRGPESVCNSILWERNDSNNRQFNNLAHGITLSDFYVPVSKNYENELKSDKQASGIALDAVSARKDTGSIVGIVNGLDRALNTTEAKAGWLKNAFNINLKTYNHKTPIDEVMDARQHNKMQLFDNYVTPIANGKTTLGGKSFNVVDSPMKVSREEFENAPLLCFAHRLTNQKGLDTFQTAIKEVFNTWEEKHPGMPKPVVIAGGQLEEEEQREFLTALKDPSNYNDPKDVDRILALEGFMPNPALYAAATYFNAPSRFEPCGLTQGECYAMGTPVLATATGGFVDTIFDGKNGFVAPYNSFHAEVERNGKPYKEWLGQTGHAFAEKMNEALDTFFNDKDKYKSIVQNNLNENLSWNRGTADDAIHQHMSKLGINKDDNIEANIAPVRQYIAPILKQFDALQKGKITEKTFEDKTPVMELAKNDVTVKAKYDSILKTFDTHTDTRRNKINDTIQDLDKHVADYNTKIEINPNDSSSKGKLEIINLKKGMEQDKLDTINKSEKVVEHDRQMFDKLVKVYVHNKTAENKIDINADKEFNSWKNEIITKYCA